MEYADCGGVGAGTARMMRMSDFELLTLVFTVIGLLIAAFKLGNKQ